MTTDEIELRLRCLKLAVQHGQMDIIDCPPDVNVEIFPRDPLRVAQSYYDFVTGAASAEESSTGEPQREYFTPEQEARIREIVAAVAAAREIHVIPSEIFNARVREVHEAAASPLLKAADEYATRRHPKSPPNNGGCDA